MESELVQPLWKSVWTRSRVAIWYRKPTPGKNENSNLKGYKNLNVHNSTIYNSQDFETTPNNWLNRICYTYIHIYIYIWIYIYTHTYIMEYYSAIKNNEILLFAATWMDLENIIHGQVRESQIPYDVHYIWNLKVVQMDIYTKHNQTHRHSKQT